MTEREWVPTTERVREGFASDPEAEYCNPTSYGGWQNELRKAFDRWLAQHDREVLDAAKPRVIETADELEALPVGSVVLDSDDAPEGRTAWTVEEDETGRWWRNGELALNANSLLLFGPVTVLWEGGES